MYKDKNKQREAVRLAVQRYRAKQRGYPLAYKVIPKDAIVVIPSVVIPKQPKTQSYCPMMVGYVPPKT